MNLKKVDGYKVIKIRVPTLLSNDGKTIKPLCPDFVYKEPFSVQYSDNKNIKQSASCILFIEIKEENIITFKKKISDSKIEYVPADTDLLRMVF